MYFYREKDQLVQAFLLRKDSILFKRILTPCGYYHGLSARKLFYKRVCSYVCNAIFNYFCVNGYLGVKGWLQGVFL